MNDDDVDLLLLRSALDNYRDDNARLRAGIAVAVKGLNQEHCEEDLGRISTCGVCGSVWPCDARRMADDLTAILEREEG